MQWLNIVAICRASAPASESSSGAPTPGTRSPSPAPAQQPKTGAAARPAQQALSDREGEATSAPGTCLVVTLAPQLSRHLQQGQCSRQRWGPLCTEVRRYQLMARRAAALVAGCALCACLLSPAARIIYPTNSEQHARRGSNFVSCPRRLDWPLHHFSLQAS